MIADFWFRKNTPQVSNILSLEQIKDFHLKMQFLIHKPSPTLFWIQYLISYQRLTQTPPRTNCIYKPLLWELLAPQKVWVISRNPPGQQPWSTEQAHTIDHLLKSGKETLWLIYLWELAVTGAGYSELFLKEGWAGSLDAKTILL